MCGVSLNTRGISVVNGVSHVISSQSGSVPDFLFLLVVVTVLLHRPRGCSALFLAQACKHRLASVPGLWTVLA